MIISKQKNLDEILSPEAMTRPGIVRKGNVKIK